MAVGAGGKGKTRGAAESFLCPASSAWQGEAAVEKTCAEAGRALWYVLHASTARCWWLRSCRRRRRCTNRRRVLASGRYPIRGLFLMPRVQNLVPCILEVLTKQMHLRGIGAGGTEESRSGGGGWTGAAPRGAPQRHDSGCHCILTHTWHVELPHGHSVLQSRRRRRPRRSRRR